MSDAHPLSNPQVLRRDGTIKVEETGGVAPLEGLQLAGEVGFDFELPARRINTGHSAPISDFFPGLPGSPEPGE